MALKNIRQKIGALIAGVLLTFSAGVWAGLESGTYISDLVATNPLGSDLASTIDDHIRLLKSTIKNTFPNINNAVTVTDEQLNAVATNVSANPTGTIGLTAVNGSAATYIRSDGAPALSQAIVPTWTGAHTFSRSGLAAGPISAVMASSASPAIGWNESGGAANNRLWVMTPSSEQFQFLAFNDALGAAGTVFTVDRNGTTIDTVAFPTNSSAAFRIGTSPAAVNSSRFIVGTGSNVSVAQFENNSGSSSGTHTVNITNAGTAGDSGFVRFATESSGAGTERGSIIFNRAGGVTAYQTSSADSLKKNIRPAKSARKVIDCVKVLSHDWKNSNGHMDYWVTAGTLNPCAPWAVTYKTSPELDGQVAVDLLVPALIKYVQEQDARISRLESNAARRH